MAKLNIRPGFTITEIMVALVAIAVAGIVVVQCAVMGLRELASLKARQAATELAANVLEAARARPWNQLDKDWAVAQTVPGGMKDLLPEGKLVVTVEPVKAPAQTRRVTVEVSWQFDPEQEPQSVQLTTILSPRTAKHTGGEQ